MVGGGALTDQGHLDTPSRASASLSACDSEVIADPQVHHHRFFPPCPPPSPNTVPMAATASSSVQVCDETGTHRHA